MNIASHIFCAQDLRNVLVSNRATQPMQANSMPISSPAQQQSRTARQPRNRAGGVREFLGKRFEISVDRIVICEVYRNKIFSILGQDRDDESLATTDVWMAYEVATELPKVENSPSSRFGLNYNRADSSVTTVKIAQKHPLLTAVESD